MSDSQNPGDVPENRPIGEPPAQPVEPAQPAAAAPGQSPPVYSQAPAGYAPAPGYAVAPVRPGRTLGIVAFIISFFVGLIGLILGIVALVQSRKAGQQNGFALAAIIIGAVAVVLTIILWIVIGASIAAACTANPGYCS